MNHHASLSQSECAFPVTLSELGAVLGALVASMVTAALAWRADFGFISFSDSREGQLFELFGACAAAMLGLLFWFFQHRNPDKSPEKRVPLICFALVLLFFSFFITEFSQQSVDYTAFQRAAAAVIQGNNPYLGTKYEYPPLYAFLMTTGLQAIHAVFGANHSESGQLLFFFQQGLQLLRLALVFFLLFHLGRKMKLEPIRSALLTTALMLFNVPLFRTLKYNQTNLIILVLLLLILLLPKRQEGFKGILAALGAHLKLFPLILFLPWLLMRRMKAMIFFSLGLAVIFLLQILLFDNLVVFKEWFSFFLNRYPEYTQLRNNCLLSLFFNTFNFLKFHLYFPTGMTPLELAKIASTTTIPLFVLFFVYRGIKREQSFGRHSLSDEADWQKGFGHFSDALLLMFLISPSAWEHHYVLLLPVLMGVAAKNYGKLSKRSFIAFFLILIPPAFDLFPFSYHRLLGTLLLLSTLPITNLNPENVSS